VICLAFSKRAVAQIASLLVCEDSRVQIRLKVVWGIGDKVEKF